MPEPLASRSRPTGPGFPGATAHGAVLAGGLLGSAARAAVAAAFPAGPGAFPAATLIVNLLGSLLLGLYLARRQRAVVWRWSLQFWAVGALGSFTTFSAFSLEVVRLVESGSASMAVAYVALSVIGGLTAAMLGDRLGSVGR